MTKDPKTRHWTPGEDTDGAERAALAALRRPLTLTRLGLVGERAVRAFWPLWSVVLVVLGAMLLGLHEVAPLEVVWGAAVLSVIGATWAMWFALRSFRWPAMAEAQARLDASLPGRPIQALGDRQAVGTADPASVAVWTAHLRRMAARLAGARAVPGDFRLAARDPYGLRFVAALFFAVAVIFGSVLKVATVGDVARGAGAAVATGPAWEGWVEPPAYTGRPALYLNDLAEGPLALPRGTRVSLRLYGEVGALTVDETVSGRVGEDIPPASAPTQDFEITQAGHLAIAGDGGRRWEVSIDPDGAPSVELSGRMEREAAGTMRQPFTAEDDFGVMSGTGRFALDLEAVDRRYGLAAAPDSLAPIAFDLPMPFTGARDLFSLEIVEDFSGHPWVGLPVILTLEVTDAAGQTGTSQPETMTLPGRRFFQPVARALIEQRRDLLWAKANGARVVNVLRTVTHRPDDVIPSSSVYLQLRMLIRRLDVAVAVGLTDAAQAEAAEALWQIALQLEEGDLSDALARLRRAQDQLSEAMRNGATDEEIARLMQELREAMQDYMRQLAQQQQQRGQDQQQAQNSREITGDQLEQMLQRLQELMEQGRMAEAQQLLEQLQRMMENMQVTEGGQQGQQSPGQQAMEGLAETLRQQQGLSDESFDQLQNQFGQGQQGQQQPGQQGQGQQGQGQQSQGQQFGQGQQGQGQGGQQPGQGQGMSELPGAEELAQRQRQLREELQRQQQNLPGAGTAEGDAARDSLGRAGEAMEDAERNLNRGDLAEAIDDQSRAMEALREGMRDLGEALAQQQQQQQGGQQGQAMGQGNPEGRRDPLGREQGTEGQLGSNENLLQGEDTYRRARDLLDEIRRRSGEQDRPEIELEYLRRLLDRF